VDLLTYRAFGRLLLPNLDWIVLIFGLTPMIALASVGLTVIISARVRGFKEAQQISAVLVVPIIAMLLAQASGAMIFGAPVVGALTLIFALVDVFLFRFGVRIFQRESILSQTG
jgi:ABC-2 type transport system permease protein